MLDYYLRIHGERLGKINAPFLTRVVIYPAPCAVIIMGLATGEEEIEFCQWASETGRYTGRRCFDDFEIELVKVNRLITVKKAELLSYGSTFGHTGGKFSVVVRSKDREIYGQNRFGDHHFIPVVRQGRLSQVVLLPRSWKCPFKPDESKWHFRIIKDDARDINGDLQIDIGRWKEMFGKQLYRRLGEMLVSGIDFGESDALRYDVCGSVITGPGLEARYDLPEAVVSPAPALMRGKVEFFLKPQPEAEESEATVEPQIKAPAVAAPAVMATKLRRVRFPVLRDAEFLNVIDPVTGQKNIKTFIDTVIVEDDEGNTKNAYKKEDMKADFQKLAVLQQSKSGTAADFETEVKNNYKDFLEGVKGDNGGVTVVGLRKWGVGTKCQDTDKIKGEQNTYDDMFLVMDRDGNLESYSRVNFEGTTATGTYNGGTLNDKGYPAIADGVYKLNTIIHSGYNALTLNNNGQIPTIGENPQYPGRGNPGYADYVHIHKGGSDWTWSKSCLTIYAPKDDTSRWNRFIANFPVKPVGTKVGTLNLMTL